MKVTVTWTAPTTDENGNSLPSGSVLKYDVIRDGVKIAEANSPSYVDTTIEQGKTYTYTSRAWISVGFPGEAAQPASITIPSGAVVPGATSNIMIVFGP